MFANHNNRNKALTAWGPDAPAWVLLLADECDRAGQRAAGDLIGYASAVVSRIINAKYPGDIVEIEQLVRAKLGAEEVMCPKFGRIPLKSCIRNRRRKVPTNGIYAELAGICRVCPNNTDRPEQED